MKDAEGVMWWCYLGAVAGAVSGLVLSACAAFQKPPCNLNRELEIDTAYLQEARSACRYYTYATCPTLPAIRAKYRAQRLEAAQCSQ